MLVSGLVVPPSGCAPGFDGDPGVEGLPFGFVGFEPGVALLPGVVLPVGGGAVLPVGG